MIAAFFAFYIRVHGCRHSLHLRWAGRARTSADERSGVSRRHLREHFAKNKKTKSGRELRPDLVWWLPQLDYGSLRSPAPFGSPNHPRFARLLGASVSNLVLVQFCFSAHQ